MNRMAGINHGDLSSWFMRGSRGSSNNVGGTEERMNEGMEQMDREVELDLRELIYMIRRRLWFIILTVVLAVGSSGAISLFVLEPIYKASTTIMVGKPADYIEGNQLQIQDLNLNQRLARTYGEIVKSRRVSEDVISQLKLNLTPQQLKNKTSVDLVKDTEFITISVTDTDPELAAVIANKVAEVFRDRVMDIMKVDNVQVLDDAIVPTSHIKPKPKLNMAIAGALGMTVSIFVVFLLEYLDNTIKTPMDIERYLGLNVIGTIPMIQDS
jgi:capsular polysaccharide biosynthesis protein